ncbi:hypothetical protein CROQUDRAFT_49466 [Cronartium quercuum f. sp. fusiforme G11]|uniref:Choline/carnitine acyltransferase domain-containing protein n=1 Tax=Cronartium quercuum f. sp. fusiforme G11 TaxID=708437 RepID=A0A9P6NFC4_9BASI|nr:hypothetical protein CROQUDRAFT_49466 [Cronartium quercuum f. sp. fusiforme G11]
MTGIGDLPKLPIPPLKDTCERYLAALEALQTPDEHAATKAVVARFLESDGPRLQEQLVTYAAQRPSRSYIEEFWYEAYLHHTSSVVLNLNPFFILEDDPTPARGNQLTRAASLILASLGFVHDLRTGQLEPDSVRGTPLDMTQYDKLFGTARVPMPNGCQMRTASDSRHVVILRRGQFYWFDVLDSKHRPCLTERELLNSLHAILRDADRTPTSQVAESAIGLLTTETRPIWASVRAEMLVSNLTNSRCLAIVDHALFIVCLDDSSPENADEMCATMLSGTTRLDGRGRQLGTCTNRYYDKLQLIVCANGIAGVNFEHSAVDGHTVLRFVGDVYTELILRFARSINSASRTLFKACSSKEEKVDYTPKKLEWVISSELKTAIRFAETRLSDLICQNEVAALEFEGYGKNFITTHNFSPDAFVQMAFQVCYFSLYGRFESTYEPAMTKAFFHGRTEGIRTVSPQSVRFAQTFCSDANPSAKIEALRTACASHAALTKRCAKGLGQDRILYAMWSLAKGDAELFRDPGYGMLNHSVLSTSNCGNPALRMFGFGPVVDDGYGLGYIIKDDGLSVVGSSKHRQTRRFLDCLRSYLLEIQRLLRQEAGETEELPVLGFNRESSTRVVRAGVLKGVDQWEGRWGGMVQPESSKKVEGDSDVLSAGYGFFDVGEIDCLAADRRNVIDRKGKTFSNPPGLLHLITYAPTHPCTLSVLV